KFVRFPVNTYGSLITLICGVLMTGCVGTITGASPDGMQANSDSDSVADADNDDDTDADDEDDTNTDDSESFVPPDDATPLIVGVGPWGLRISSANLSTWTTCGGPSTGSDHTPDLLRDVAY